MAGMQRYKFEYGGKIYEVEAPEGTTPAQLQAAVDSPTQAAPAPAAPQPEAPSTLSQFGRAAALLGRDALEGAGGLVGLVTDPIVYGAGAAMGQNFAGMKDTAGQLADAIGLPKPETGTERIVSGVQQALAGGGGMLGGARLLAGSAAPVTAAVGRELGRGAGSQLVGAATGAGASGIVREEGGGAGA